MPPFYLATQPCMSSYQNQSIRNNTRLNHHMIASDNDSGFTNNAIMKWADRTKLNWCFVAPRKPIQNAFIKSCNARPRDNFIHETLFS